MICKSFLEFRNPLVTPLKLFFPIFLFLFFFFGISKPSGYAVEAFLPHFFISFFLFSLTKNSTHTHVHARITHTSTHRASSSVHKCTAGVAQPILGTEWNKRRVVPQLPGGKHIWINNYCKRKYKKTKGNYIFLFLSTTLKRFPVPFDISL